MPEPIPSPSPFAPAYSVPHDMRAPITDEEWRSIYATMPSDMLALPPKTMSDAAQAACIRTQVLMYLIRKTAMNIDPIVDAKGVKHVAYGLSMHLLWRVGEDAEKVDWRHLQSDYVNGYMVPMILAENIADAPIHIAKGIVVELAAKVAERHLQEVAMKRRGFHGN